MAFYPYLFFSGTCREAMTRYRDVFGGELVLLPFSDMPGDDAEQFADHAELIMHGALTFDDGQLLMASDDPTGSFERVQGMQVNYTTTDPDEARRVFDALADGGEITMPIAETFWSPMFGMCVDRFGTPWMINVPGETPPA